MVALRKALWKKVVTLLALAMMLLGISVVAASTASAHNPGVTPECGSLKVNLTDYNNEHDNSVKVTLDGVVVDDVSDFGSSFSKTYTLTKYEQHPYEVKVRAGDDPRGDHGWTKTFTGTVPSCEHVIPFPQPQQTDSCGPNNAAWVKQSDTESVEWEQRDDGHLWAHAKDGYVFPDESRWHDYGVAKDSGTACPVQQPRASVQTSCSGKARVTLDNRASNQGTVTYMVRASKRSWSKSWTFRVNAGSVRAVTFGGHKFAVGTKIRVWAKGKLLAYGKIPSRCAHPPVNPPHTGLRTTSASHAQSISVPAANVNRARLVATGTRGGAQNVSSSPRVFTY